MARDFKAHWGPTPEGALADIENMSFVSSDGLVVVLKIVEPLLGSVRVSFKSFVSVRLTEESAVLGAVDAQPWIPGGPVLVAVTSQYLDWYKERAGAAARSLKHYRILSDDYFIDVLAEHEPVIEPS